MPVGLLWQMARDERDWPISENRSSDPVEAIGAASRDLPGTDAEFAAFVIPNWLRQAQQQAMLDSLSGTGTKWYLIWRPVAAARAWIEHGYLPITDTSKRRAVGKIAFLHLGLFECEFAIVDIVAEPTPQGTRLLPARVRLDKHADYRPGLISDALMNGAADQCGTASSSSDVWRQMWATPWILQQLSALRGGTAVAGLNAPKAYQQPVSRLVPSASHNHEFNSSGVRWRAESVPEVEAWVADRLAKCPILDGAVVTGELASIRHGQQTIAAQFLQKNVPADRLLIADAEQDLSSFGAQLLCRDLADDQPAYLTKLPLLRTVVSQYGEPKWISLLAEDDAYVLGGQRWARPEPVRGIRLPGSDVLKLAIDHEDFDEVREAAIEIPSDLPPNQEAQLLVEITPAQGNARVEVGTVPATAMRNPLIANLQRMERAVGDENQVLTSSEYLKQYPRIAPPLLLRLGSPRHWKAIVERDVMHLIGRNPRNWSTDDMWRIKEALVAKRRRQDEMRNITAIGSDGVVEDYREELNELVSAAVSATRSRDTDRHRTATRLLAYTSTSDEAVQKILREVIASKGPWEDHQFRLLGNCLRGAKPIADFLAGCSRSSLSSHHIRTIAELVTYREEALELVSSDQCIDLFAKIGSTFSRDVATSNQFGLNFRYLTLCVAFLLRKRIFDDDFVDPQSEIAREIKTACEALITAHTEKRAAIMAGSVDLPAVMRQLIMYIDRQGRGAFVLAMS